MRHADDDFNQGVPADAGNGPWRSLRWKDVGAATVLEGEPRAHREIERVWGVSFEQMDVPTAGGQSGCAFVTRMPTRSHHTGRKKTTQE